jgi:hypothetical protein
VLASALSAGDLHLEWQTVLDHGDLAAAEPLEQLDDLRFQRKVSDGTLRARPIVAAKFELMNHSRRRFESRLAAADQKAFDAAEVDLLE